MDKSQSTFQSLDEIMAIANPVIYKAPDLWGLTKEITEEEVISVAIIPFATVEIYGQRFDRIILGEELFSIKNAYHIYCIIQKFRG